MIKTIVLLAVLGVFTFLIILSLGCASSSMYMKENSCILDRTGAFYTCYYMQNGEVLSYRKSFNSRSTTKQQENIK